MTENTALTTHRAVDPFAAAAAAMGAVDGSFMKFNANTGDFEYGPKDSATELPHGALLIAEMSSPKHGFICWKEGEAVEEIMISIFDGQPPPVTSLTDHGPYKKYDDGSVDGWVEQVSVDFFLEEDGTKLLFKGSSKSAKRAFANFLAEYSKVYKKQTVGSKPVIELGAVGFEPKPEKTGGKRIGKKFAPIFKIVDWIDADSFDNLLENNKNPEKGEDNQDNYTQPAAKTEVAPTTGTSARRSRASV